MAAADYPILIEQGATYRLPLAWKTSAGAAVDLTGYTARMQVRRKVDADEALLNLTTENGGVALGGTAGTITVTASDTLTAALTVKSGVYDLELRDAAGVVTRLLQGCVTISLEVTR